MSSRGTRIVLLVAAVVVFLDQLTKQWVTRSLELGESREIIGSILKLHLIHNPGAAFSFLTGSTWVFTILAGVVSIVIVTQARKITNTYWMYAVGGVLGGALGNFIDRLTNVPGFGIGHVIDFIEVPYWPIFNIADSSIFVSSISLVFLTYKGITMNGLTHKSHGASAAHHE
ncbi:MAG: hypothetical protein RIS75_742 [Actinomycetota bacterium]|jgi:signal peptidase II